jgi:hypothetical protein
MEQTPSNSGAAQPDRQGSAEQRERATFDLGTATGFTKQEYPGGPLRSMTIHLATDQELEQQRREGRERTLDIRFARLFAFAREQISLSKPIDVMIEQPPPKSSGLQCQFLASLQAAVCAAVLLNRNARIFSVPVATLKKFATGDGGAQKPAMAVALANRCPRDYKLVEGGLIQKADGTVIDHNEVDAIWLALYAEAVERGDESLVGAYQRKQMKIAQRRQKKHQRKLKAQLERAAKLAQAKAKKRALRLAIKALGSCCGVFRKQSMRYAVCPKCGSRLPLPKIPLLSEPAPAQSPTAPGLTPMPASLQSLDFTAVPQR